MGAVGVVLGLFLAFSLAISYVSGDKEKNRLEGQIKEKRVTERKMEDDLYITKQKLATEAENYKELDGKYRAEQADKKRLGRAGALHEGQRRSLGREGGPADTRGARGQGRTRLGAGRLAARGKGGGKSGGPVGMRGGPARAKA